MFVHIYTYYVRNQVDLLKFAIVHQLPSSHSMSHTRNFQQHTFQVCHVFLEG